MKSKIPLEKQGKDEVENLFNWIKKSKKNADLSNVTQTSHCNNYATSCCLNCDKCWGGNYSLKLNKKGAIL